MPVIQPVEYTCTCCGKKFVRYQGDAIIAGLDELVKKNTGLDASLCDECRKKNQSTKSVSN